MVAYTHPAEEVSGSDISTLKLPRLQQFAVIGLYKEFDNIPSPKGFLE